MIVTIASDLRPIVSLGIVAVDVTHVVDRDVSLDEPLARAEAAVRIHPPEERTAVRSMYRRVGIDPTKTRPSSEALLRRVRRGEALPRINTLVDICNWCSLELQLPYGLYDKDRLEGDLTLRRGAAGEQYAGIRKDVVHMEGRLALVDALGPFGNPTSDSARTKVTVIFAPREIAAVALFEALDRTASRLVTFGGGREADRQIV
jgi:DNA/RNA-binding domain of Phe-tRNA-synthetase-like protein